MLGRIRLDSQIIGQTFEGKKLYGVTHELIREIRIQRDESLRAEKGPYLLGTRQLASQIT